MNLGSPYKRSTLADHYDAIVVGSGIGGLTAASLLARHKQQRVLVLERHYTAGGFTHAFRRPGFEWDVGVHYIGDVGHPKAALRKLFDHLSDGQLAWADMGDVYDHVHIGETRFDYVRGADHLESAFCAAYPAEAAGIRRYFAAVKSLGWRTSLYFAERAVPAPVASLLGAVMRYPAMKYAARTTGEVVNACVRDPMLRALLTAQWGDYGLPPGQSSFFVHALVTSHYFRGASYPVGGASRIAATIIPSIERAGGAVVTRAEVASILIAGGAAVGVTLADGRELRADTVISDAGAALTYGQLLPEGARPVELRAGGLGGIASSVSHATLYLGFHQTAEALGLPRHNIWSYEGPDHDAAYAGSVSGSEIGKSAFLSFASARDPDFARRHPGNAVGEVTAFVPSGYFAAELAEAGEPGPAYAEKKAELSERLLAILYRELPQLRGTVAHAELSTPLSTRRFVAHPQGEIYGLAHTPARFQSRWLKPRTPIRGLYLTGADVCTGGVGGALMGGVLTASALYRGNLMGKLMAG